MMVRPTKFEISEASSAGTRTVALAGELDLSTVPALAQRVEALGDQIERLILDLGDVTFMDSSALRLLIELNQRAEKEAWDLVLIPPRHESARVVLRMTGADAALPFVDDSPS